MYVEANTQGNPRPRNTLTQFEPVTFPIAESAYSLYFAAIILAKVSGKEVPNATIVIPVTELGIVNAHPNNIAISATTNVTKPVNESETMNAGHPPFQ